MSENTRNRGRMAIYTLAGFYLLYLSKDMYGAIPKSTGTTKTLLMIFTVLFVIIGAAMMVGGIYMGYRLAKNPPQESEQEEEAPEEISEAENVSAEGQTEDVPAEESGDTSSF